MREMKEIEREKSRQTDRYVEVISTFLFVFFGFFSCSGSLHLE
jgi:hypothetical protein